MAVVHVVLIALAGFLILGTLLPLVPEPYWWVRAFDYPRAQIAVAALGVLVALGVYHGAAGWPEGWEWGLPGVLALVVVYQGARMLPYTPLWPAESVRAEAPDEARSLRVVVSNVEMANRDHERWVRVVTRAEPDVIAAVEVDAWWTGRIAAALGEDYPHRVEVPQENTYGMAVYSRFPLAEAEVRRLVEETVPSLFTRVELPSGETVRLVVVHPRPPRPDIPQGSELRDAELVLVAKALGHDPEATLVAGDLNDVAWSATTRRFQALSGLLDPRRGRGVFPTFPVKYPPLRYPLDHVFHSDDLGLVALHRLDDVGGDHFPMLIEVALTAGAEAEQEAPEADAEDVQEGEESVDEAADTLREETPADTRERNREDR